MAHKDDLIANDIEAYLKSHEEKTLLRFITCGSVDDGKSTLIGRMLYESKMIFDDQLAAIENDSKKLGTQGADIDFALLVDGLASEREQGITIDVAYRFFSTDKRKFIVADTPGHEQYTRNMATGASTADLAIILIDARKGILTQTCRHSFIASLLGIKNVVLAVNKMDLVEYSQETFDTIVGEYDEFAKLLRADGEIPFNIMPIPVSALKGDNIIVKSEATPWYNGPSLLEHLETVPIREAELEKPFRMPVQWVNRPNLDFRGFAGQIASGSIKVGDEIKALPSAKTSKVKSILVSDESSEEAIVGQSVTICLEDEIDISRGDVVAGTAHPPEIANQFETTILWMAEDAMLPGRSYVLKSGTQTAQATVTVPKFKVNVNTLAHEPATKLELNEIGECNIAVDKKLVFDPYDDNKEMGSFILIDRLSNETVGMGMIRFALRRSSNIHWQEMEITKEFRSQMKGHKSAVLWFTGLSGSGKSTIASLLEKRLSALGKHTYTLDGDNVRHGLNKDLGFTDADRVENIRRITQVAKLMSDAGLIVLTSFISPFRSERQMARNEMAEGEFIEIFVDTPLEVAEQRDVKGLYKKARAGELANFTGIDSPYEAPQNSEIVVNTVDCSAQEAADEILEKLQSMGVLDT
ncbi:MAG: sulfate adenylyltransferase subunit CysN [Nitratireductor sp.]